MIKRKLINDLLLQENECTEQAYIEWKENYSKNLLPDLIEENIYR